MLEKRDVNSSATIRETDERILAIQDPRKVLHFRASLLWAGLTPIMVKTRSKSPRRYEWQKEYLKSTPDAVSEEASPDEMSNGILCRGLRVIDIDIDDPPISQAIASLAEKHFGETTRRYRKNSPRLTLLYRAAEGTPGKRILKGEDSQTHQYKIEVLGDGQQTVVDGIHPSGFPYQLSKQPFSEFEFLSLPAITEQQIDVFFNEATSLLRNMAVVNLQMDLCVRDGSKRLKKFAESDHGPFDDLPEALKLKMVHSCLAIIGGASPQLARMKWVRIGWACCDAEARGAVGAFGIFREWSEQRADYDEKADTEMDSIERDFRPGERSVGVASLIGQARDLPGGQQMVDAYWREGGALKPSFERALGIFSAAATTEAENVAAAVFGTNSKKEENQTQRLLSLCSAMTLFHTPIGVAYADTYINGHRETLAVNSSDFSESLSRAYFERYKAAPRSEAKRQATECIAANAKYGGIEMEVALRVGEHDKKIYIDLGDESWAAVEIDTDGWRILPEPPLRFRRAPGMLALPEPERGGSLDSLRSVLNIGTTDNHILTISWILSTFHPAGSYPILALTGEHGSAKSTFVRIIRRLTDPSFSPLQSVPKDVRDLYISAQNSHVLAYDNVSSLTSDQSDNFCRLSTGGGFRIRTLYSNDSETLIEATSPIILNGITDFIFRPDLADRSIIIPLQPIPQERRRANTEIESDLRLFLPGIFGCLLDAISHGLKTLPSIKLSTLPRMADYAIWATACGDGRLWEIGGFMAAYSRNRISAIDDVIANDVIATGVVSLLETEAAAGKSIWQGTASQLLQCLRTQSAFRCENDLPRMSNQLSNRLKRAEPFLRQRGILMQFNREARTRTITLTNTAQAMS